MTLAAIPLLATTYTHDPRLISLVTAASYVPALLFGLHSGAIVDRHDRRVLMCSSDGLRLVVVGALAVLVASGADSLGWLVFAALGLGAADIMFANAAAAFVPMLVSRHRLHAANSWLLSSQTVSMQFVGLPVGGVLFVIAPAVPFAVDAGTYAVALALVLAIDGTYRAPAVGAVTRPSVGQAVREGLVWLWRHRVLRTLALLTGAMNLAFATGESTLVLYTGQVLGLEERGYALVLSLLAVGGVAGALAAGALSSTLGTGRVVSASVLVMALAFMVPAVTSSLGAVVVALLLGGAASMTWNVVTMTLRQQVVPAALLGRVTSAYRVIGLGVMPLGAAAGGLLAHRFGLHAPWLVAAMTVVGFGALGAVMLSVERLEVGSST